MRRSTGGALAFLFAFSMLAVASGQSPENRSSSMAPATPDRWCEQLRDEVTA